MPLLQEHSRAPSDEHKPSNAQLPTPALSPIEEQAPFAPLIVKVHDDSSKEAESVRATDKKAVLSIVTNGNHHNGDIRSPQPTTTDSACVLKLSPSQLDALTKSPESLPLRVVDEEPQLETLSHISGSSRDIDAVGSTAEVIRPSLNGDAHSDARYNSADEGLAADRVARRPSQGIRSVTSPLLKRRESASAPRNPKSTRDGSATRRPSLTPIKIVDDQKSDLDTAVRPTPSRDRPPSPMPQVIPLPPLSFPTYLQLELSSEKPSALYIHQAAGSEYPYESSKVKFERLVNFLGLPPQLEQLLWFGTLACLDAWLYNFTILPLRFFSSLWLLVSWWATSANKEVGDVCLIVLKGIKRLWRRERQRPALHTARNVKSTSYKQGTDVRAARASNMSATDTAGTPTRGRRGSSLPRPRTAKRKPSGLSPSHKADILQGLLIIFSCLILVRFDASRMYHSIRGQAAIKLYVIYNVLEVCDRLFAAIGQDIMECLFSKECLERKANGRSKVIRPFWMFLLALIYTVMHATMLFYQVVTLNVAVNSYSNALLTLLMSNQFVEIKGTVFKRFEKENLFQLTCADIVERFQLWLMLSIIASRNLVEVGGWSLSSFTATNFATTPISSSSNTSSAPPNSTATPPSTASSLLPHAFSLLPSLNNPVLTPFLIVLGSEMLVDWLKHAYINKFNSVKPAIYGRFLDVLAKDYYSHAFADQNLMKRLGLPTLPLVCLVLRAAGQVWTMFVATGSFGASAASAPLAATKSLSAELGNRTEPALLDPLWKIDTMIRQALGRTSFLAEGATLRNLWRWSTDDVIAFSTAVIFFLLLYMFLLAFKLVLGMALLSFAQSRYKGMKERERELYDTNSRRVGGWGVTEVDEDKRRWIYQDDEAGLRKLQEREQRAKDRRKENEAGKATGIKLDGVSRYAMISKRLW